MGIYSERGRGHVVSYERFVKKADRWRFSDDSVSVRFGKVLYYRGRSTVQVSSGNVILAVGLKIEGKGRNVVLLL